MNVFELYSGVGGMHLAVKESKIQATISRAVDINTTANAVYRHNFPETVLLEKNIQSLTEADFNNLNIDMIMMSPPCQPYTRVGLKMDIEDNRNDSFLHIIDIIPKLQTVKYILLENVLGFEVSKARDLLLKAFDESNFNHQEFLLNPNQFGVPNSRLRYYLLAKKRPLKFCFKEEAAIMKTLPELNNSVDLLNQVSWKNESCKSNHNCCKIECIIEEGDHKLVPDEKLFKYGKIFDIVTLDSSNSCCFTKAYSHYVEGTGSVFCRLKKENIDRIFKELNLEDKESEKYSDLLKELNLRYFTCREVARLMCFPESFSFPRNMTDKQKYRLLGNSLNVTVVGFLVKLLVS